MPITQDPSRTILQVAGPDAESFLQGLLTNDIRPAAADRAVYAALLTPQGKFLFDAFVARPQPQTFWLDVEADRAAELMKRLSMYKLRADLTLDRLDDDAVFLAWDEDALPAKALLVYGDPRDPKLGRRGVAPQAAIPLDPAALQIHERRRIELAVPAAGAEFLPNATYPLEAGLERAAGVDFKKGCFVGQEIVARMKHRAALKKALLRVRIDGAAPPPGTEIQSDGRPAGFMGSSRDDQGLALLRLDRLGGALTAADASLTVLDPPLSDDDV